MTPWRWTSGASTFYFDQQRRLWKGLGEKETRMPVFVESPDAPTDEVCSCGVKIEQKILGQGLIFQLGPVMGDKLPPGRYTVHLIFAPKPAFADVTFRGSPTLLPAVEKLMIPSGGTQPVRITRTLEVTQGAVKVMIFPTFGTVYLCGAVLEPAVPP